MALAGIRFIAGEGNSVAFHFDPIEYFLQGLVLVRQCIPLIDSE
jgi:hypothetical protein